MKRYRQTVRSLLIICLTLCCLILPSRANGSVMDETTEEQPYPGFPVGEALLFRLKWGVIPVGTARIVSEWTTDTPPTVRIRIHVRSNAFLNRIYRIDDYLETIVNPTNMLSIRFEKHMNEAGKIQRDVTTFDRELGTVNWSNVLKTESRSYNAPRDIRDIIALMYLLRASSFQIGEVNNYVVSGDTGPAAVKIVVKEEQPFKTDRYGPIPALHLRPEVGDDALFLGRVPRDLWISASHPHVLLFLSVDAPVGTIKLILDAIEGVEKWPESPTI